MPGKYWGDPYYKLTSPNGEEVTIDVTTSISPGLPPNGLIENRLIPLLKERGAQTVLDFGAGALRHTLPLLEAGFQVWAVEFEEAFKRPEAQKAYKKAKSYGGNFSALIYPKDLIAYKNQKFDAALLSFVLQTMPIPQERLRVIAEIYKKLHRKAVLFYCSRWNQKTDQDDDHLVSDGYYRYPKRIMHSFYTEFTTTETDRMFVSKKFKRNPRNGNWSTGGSEQIFIYIKGPTIF